MSARTVVIILSYFLVFSMSLSAPTSVSADDCDYVCGDADSDGRVSIRDIEFLVSYLFRSGTAPELMNTTDVDGSGSFNLVDVIYLIDYLFRGGPAPDGCPSLINIIDLQPNDDIVNGTAYVIDTAKTKVVLWAKTDRWYVQPTIAEPYTIIQGDGTWSNSTYPWDRMVALLVDQSYVPGATRDYHPAADAGVLCWDEYPDKSFRDIYWSDYRWTVKNAGPVDPGPNYFSDDTANVVIEQEDRLRLKIDFRDGKWYCAEVVLDHSLGYGLYIFKLDSRVDNLDFNTIFAGFIYETINQEFDIEFSQRLAEPFNAQYVAQPWYIPGNMEFFDMPNTIQTSHSFEWRPDRIIFNSWTGHDDSPTPTTLIHTWTYTGANIPIPGGERMIFNLYLYGGEPPIQGVENEVIITSFGFTGQ